MIRLLVKQCKHKKVEEIRATDFQKVISCIIFSTVLFQMLFLFVAFEAWGFEARNHEIEV